MEDVPEKFVDIEFMHCSLLIFVQLAILEHVGSLMCDRNLRTSTTKKSEALKERIRDLSDIRRLKKVSTRYSELIRREQISFALSALDLAHSVANIYGADSSGGRTEENLNGKFLLPIKIIT